MSEEGTQASPTEAQDVEIKSTVDLANEKLAAMAKKEKEEKEFQDKLASMEDEIKAKIEKNFQEKIGKIKQRKSDIDKRVASLRMIHENMVIIERLDNKKFDTVLAADPKGEKKRVRTSWVGRIVRISDIDSFDDLIEMKKKLVKVDEIIYYNPDSAYSLNIKDFEEVWVIAVNNILNVDEDFDLDARLEKNLRFLAEAEERKKARDILVPKKEIFLAEADLPKAPMAIIRGSDKDIQHRMIDKALEQMDRMKRR